MVDIVFLVVDGLSAETFGESFGIKRPVRHFTVDARIAEPLVGDRLEERCTAGGRLAQYQDHFSGFNHSLKVLQDFKLFPFLTEAKQIHNSSGNIEEVDHSIRKGLDDVLHPSHAAYRETLPEDTCIKNLLIHDQETFDDDDKRTDPLGFDAGIGFCSPIAAERGLQVPRLVVLRCRAFDIDCGLFVCVSTGQSL